MATLSITYVVCDVIVLGIFNCREIKKTCCKLAVECLLQSNAIRCVSLHKSHNHWPLNAPNTGVFYFGT